MKTVFMGSPDFAIPSLEKLYASDHEIAAVVTNIDKRRGRGGGVSPTPVKARAQELGLPVVEVDQLDDPSFEEQVAELAPELIVVVAFRILPGSILRIPDEGAINLHASLLPKYRGAAPIHWAIINGEEETGCTVFFLEESVDTGGIISREKTPIGKNETTGDLYKRLKTIGARLLAETVDDIASGDYAVTEQDDSRASPAPKLFTDDCRIDFDRPFGQVHNRIRGMSPFPTAWAELDGLKFNMYRSRVGPDIELKPGQLEMRDNRLLAGCSEGTVELVEVQIEGKKRMSGKDFMNGYHGIGLLR